MAMVPREIEPRWSDLPAIARLATERLTDPSVPWAGLGVAILAVRGVLTLVELIAYRSDGNCAAVGRHAVVVLKQRHPRQLRWRYSLVYTIGATAAVTLWVVSLVFAAAAGLAAAQFRWSLAIPVALWAVIVGLGATALVMIATAISSGNVFAPRDRRSARTWAQHDQVTLVEAYSLAASAAHPRAATVLVRRLLQIADREQVAVVALPRDDHVAKMYQAIGFAGLTGGTQRLLLRLPRQHVARGLTS
jgi:hypothetical protein